MGKKAFQNSPLSQVICPSADFPKSCQAFGTKIFRFSGSANQVYGPRRPAPSRGALRDRHKCWRGMRWTRWHQLTSDVRRGRRNRVVLMPRRWHQALGDDPRATEAIKPGTPGRSRISRKPSRRECRLLRLPCFACVRKCTFFARKARGCSLHPAFPAPFGFGGRS